MKKLTDLNFTIQIFMSPLFWLIAILKVIVTIPLIIIGLCNRAKDYLKE